MMVTYGYEFDKHHINSISNQVYNKIQHDNLFSISSEPSSVQEYIKEVLSKAWKIDPGLFRKAKDKLPNRNDGYKDKIIRRTSSLNAPKYKSSR